MRPATYESADEATILSKWFSGRDGDLENTTFALLDPTGSRRLARSGRGPSWAFENAEKFAAGLRSLAQEFPAKKAERALALVPDLRLGLNVAASDGLPLIAIVGEDNSSTRKLVDAMRDAFQKDALAGQAHCVRLDSTDSLEEYEGFVSGRTVYVLKPESFGRTAEVVTSFRSSEKKLATKLEIALQAGRIDKASHRDHVRQGRRAGISWKSKIPVSDTSATAREGGGRRGRDGT